MTKPFSYWYDTALEYETWRVEELRTRRVSMLAELLQNAYYRGREDEAKLWADRLQERATLARSDEAAARLHKILRDSAPPLKASGPGGHAFDSDGRCDCGHTTSDDPKRCTLQRAEEDD